MPRGFTLEVRRAYWELLRKSRNRPQEQRAELLHDIWRKSPLKSRTPWREQEFLVVDAETSGLQVKDSELLSLGWVVIRAGRVPLQSARHILIRPEKGVGESATVHQLRDCELEEGMTEAEALLELLQAACGRVLVFHHAPLDLAFLNRACWRSFRLPLLMPVVDTMAIEKRTLEHKHVPLVRNALRLSSCCSRYGLPPGTVHNALSDALATAQLLLAQVAHKGGDVRLGDLL